ncbi:MULTISPECIES: hypothetical protein [unclassified Bradyrhizobium]|nr:MULTISPECIES: hypothetical protein [unclassified Bradyrhizobium]WGS19171.1 hypothetical protein MTX22_32700 [Bradyrhizobium sp. ISRA463]WGS26008.1 hypothetical protein MTX19_30245 [Bradyrhizobium sp. ISRA464]
MLGLSDLLDDPALMLGEDRLKRAQELEGRFVPEFQTQNPDHPGARNI